ncbi:MAG: transporter substrate-binding domain-containing protein [bacterium]|nr:transporter substrate-binding domain-containing protein [bacterium]
MIRRVLTGWFSVCLAVLSVPASAGAGEPDAAGTLVVRGDASYPPYEFLDESGRPTGFNVDLMRAVADVMGLEIDLGLGPWSEVRAQLESGSIDALTGMSYSNERAKTVDFSTPFIILTHSLFVRKGSRVANLDDVAGKAVIVQRGDIMGDFVRQNAVTDMIVETDTQADALRLLADDQHDCALVGKLQGLYLVEELGLRNLEAVGPPILPSRYCFAVREGDVELRAVLNEGLSIVMKTGKYEEIHRKWFGIHDRRSARRTAWKIALMALLPLLATLAAVLAWTWTLRREVARKTSELRKELADRKQAEDALAQSEERLELVLQGADLGSWDWFIESDKVTFDDRWLDMVGLDREDVDGTFRGWASLVHPEDRPFTEAAVAALLEGRIPKYECEYRMKTGDGGWKWVLDRGNITARNERGEATRLSGSHLDLTDRKRLEQELLQVHKMDSIGKLAGGIAHDLNNLLAPVIGYASMIVDERPDDARLREDVAQIQDAAGRARDLTQQLLAFSRKELLQPRILSVTEAVSSFESMLRRLVREDIQIALNLDPDIWLISADPSRLQQIIMNLVVNAADAMPDGGRLTIATANVLADEEFARTRTNILPGRCVQFSVSDQGHGIDDAKLDRVFEPFYSTKAPGEGTGLGLSVVYGIVQQHRGDIAVTSQVGVGTTFTIWLPAVDAQALAPEQPALVQEDPSGRETILLAEDEGVVLKLVRRALSQYGYEVLACSTGEEALSVAGSHEGPIHLLLTDVIMPGMNGRELYDRLTKERTLQVLYMSGYTNDVIGQHGVLADGMNFIQKPFKVADLVQKVRAVLDEPAVEDA